MQKILLYCFLLPFLYSALLSDFAYANSQTTFPCDGSTGIYTFSNDSLVYITGYTTGTPIVKALFQMPLNGFNGLGANALDGYLYFQSGGTLYRLDAAGNATALFVLPASSDVGCCDQWNRYWTQGAGGTIIAVNLSTGAVVKGPYNIGNTMKGFIDIVFNPYDCDLYFQGVRFDTNGVVDPTYTIPILSPAGQYGGAAMGIDGNIWAVHNANPGNLDMINSVTGSSTNACPVNMNLGIDAASFTCYKLIPAFEYTVAAKGCSSPPEVSFTDTSIGLVGFWHWNFGDPSSGASDTSSLQDPTHNYNTPGNYTVQLLLVSGYPRNPLCFGDVPIKDSASFTVKVNGSSSSSTLALTKNTTPATCGKSNGTASVSVSGGTSPYVFYWNTGAASSSLVNQPPGTDTLIVTDARGCKDTLQVIIANLDPFTLNSTDTSLKCFGDANASLTSAVSGNSAPYTYLWSSGSTNATSSGLGIGVYTLTVTDINGCSGTITDTISGPGALVLPYSSIQTCQNSSATLSAKPAGGIGPYTYSWSNGDTTSSLHPFIPSLLLTFIPFSLTVTDANGCSITQTDTIKIAPFPIAAFKGPNTCLGIPVEFKDSSYLSIGYSETISVWNWNFGDSTSPSATENPVHIYAKPGTYMVTLTASSGPCSSSTNQTVTVFPDPKANFSASPQPTNILNPAITFTDESSGGISGNWNFGDNSDSAYIPGMNLVHIYPTDNLAEGESYSVKLLIVNQNACPDSTIKTVFVGPISTFYVPDAFTPNGDGINDTFFGSGFGLVKQEMWIWDRWGLLIFHTTDINGVWNGKVQGGASGEDAQQDVYVWKIRIQDLFLNYDTYKGQVILLR